MTGHKKVARMKLGDFREGLQFKFNVQVTKEKLDAFAAVTGDLSPLHIDTEFAKSRGFKDRLVHGAFLIGYLSRLVGMHFPGENCLVHSIKVNFLSPVYIGDSLCVKAQVAQVSLGAKVVVLDVAIMKADEITACVKGKMQVGFTDE